jgi:hypothetical protein
MKNLKIEVEFVYPLFFALGNGHAYRVDTLLPDYRPSLCQQNKQ